ncbi:MAG: T9SS type A sorting domain-containing protein [Bacteroidales bacterium]|nr:T9SS type A sorting domain-containing protein [Bacteroidales bacterium]
MKKIFTTIILCALAIATASAQDYLSFVSNQDGSTLKLSSQGSGSVNVEYSFDKTNWSTLAYNQVIEMDEDMRIYLRGDNPSGFSTSDKDYRYFVMTGSFHGSGSVMSLIDPDCQSKKIPCDWCFTRLFLSCTALEGAPMLPATTLTNNCYNNMFSSSGIMVMPELPAMTLKESCYWGMFYNCASLTIAKDLPATTLLPSCYRSMFKQCTSLENAPYLPAEEGAYDCYLDMFNGCTSLKYLKVALKAWDKNGERSQEGSTWNWVIGVAAEGKFFCPESLSWVTTTSYDNRSRVPSGWLYNPHSVTIEEESKDYITIKNWKDISFTSSTTFTTTQPEDATLQITAVNAVTANGEKVPVSALSNNSYSMVMPNDDVILSVEIGEKVIDQTDYLCFTANQDGSTIQLTNLGSVNVEYSYDKQNWSRIKDNQLLEFDQGQNIFFRGYNPTTFSNSDAKNSYRQFVMTGSISASGNIMSLIDPTCKSRVVPCELCFYALFANCTSLVSAPKLPATTLANQCYRYMFGYTRITKMPELPAMTLKDGCYKYMFEGCASLTDVFDLPATTLQNQCYKGMFYSCTSLEKAPYLPAEQGAYDCYRDMFNGCTSLKYLKVALKAWDKNGERSQEGSTWNWVIGVAAEGKFFCPESLSWVITTSYDNRSRVPSGWLYNPHNVTIAEDSKEYITISNWENISYASTTEFTTTQPEDPELHITAVNAVTSKGEKVTITALSNNTYSMVMPNDDVILSVEIGENIGDPTKYLCLYSNQDASTVKLTNMGDVNVEYSYDKVTWNSLSENYLLKLDAGDCVYFRGDNPTGFSTGGNDGEYRKFVMTGSLSASGNIMSLIDKTCTTTKIPCNYCFGGLFRECKSLVSAPELPATTLTEYCYWTTFAGSGITEVPELPAFTLQKGCYRAMFSQCTNLNKVPENLLPTTTLAAECYHYMFEGCTSLRRAPYLPAETLADYCYYQMFTGCSSLEYLSVGLKSWSEDVQGSYPYTYVNDWGFQKPVYHNNLDNWVEGVSATGTFICLETLTLETGINRVPSGWLYNPHYVYVADDSKDYITLSPEYEYVSSTSKVTFTVADRTGEDLFAKAWAVTADGDSIEATLSGNTTMEFDMPNHDVTLTVKYNYKESKITTNDYIIKVAKSAYYNDKVSFWLESDYCYKVNSITVTSGENTIDYTEADGVYTFVMPMEDVNINIDYDSYTLYNSYLINDDETVHQCANSRKVEAIKPERATEAYWDFGETHTKDAIIGDRTAPTTTFSNLYGTNTFVWTVKGDHCEMSEQITIINESVIPNVETYKETCDGTATIKANSLKEGEYCYWAKGNTTINTEDPDILSVSNLALDHNYYYYITYNDYCRDTVTIDIVNNHIEAGIIGSNPRTVNVSTTTLEAASLSMYGSTASGLWSNDDILVTIETPSNPVTAISGLENNQSYTFTYTASKGECKSKAEVVVNVDFSSCPVSASIPHATLKGLPGAVKIGDSFKLSITMETGYSLTHLEVNNKPVEVTGKEVTITVPEVKYISITGGAESVKGYLHFSNTQAASSTIKLDNHGGNDPNIEYMINHIPGWHQLDESGEITLKSSDTIYLRGNNESGFSKSETEYSRFVLSHPGFKAGGSVMSLLFNGEEYDGLPSEYCFYSLFRDCENLVTAPELPAKILREYCYARMFENCTSLQKPQDLLPAVSLEDHCYYNMYAYSGIKYTPMIQAVMYADHGMGYMFAGCADLDSVNCTFVNWLDDATENWLAGVAPEGKFVNTYLVENHYLGPSRIPEGWTTAEGTPYTGKIYTPVEALPESEDAAVTLYPNPAKAYQPVTLAINGYSGDAAVTIVNASGAQAAFVRCHDGRATVSLPSGSYFGRCTFNGKIIYFKFIVQ